MPLPVDAAEHDALDPVADGVAAHTRAQRAVRQRQRAAPASAAPAAASTSPALFRSVPFGLKESPAQWMARHGVAQPPPSLPIPAVNEEEKHIDVPDLVSIDHTSATPTSAADASPADFCGDDEDESSDDDLSTPDEELEEGEVPEAELRAHGLLPPRM